MEIEIPKNDKNVKIFKKNKYLCGKKIKYMTTFISKRLFELRKKHGFTLNQVAYELQLETSTYHKIEKGLSNSWGNYINQILDLYKIDAATFF